MMARGLRRGAAQWLTALLVCCLFSSSVAAVPIKTFREDEAWEDSQIGCGLGNSASYRDEWRIMVRGNTTVAVGVGEIPNQFVFSNPRTGQRYQSTLLAGAFPLPKEEKAFYRDWGASVAYMSDYAARIFGDRLNGVSWDNIPQTWGGNAYIFYFELWDNDWEDTYRITVAYRFEQSYYLFAMGVNLGDLPEIFEITKQAAADFEDLTAEPGTGFETTTFTGTYKHTLPEWSYSVVNPFQIIMEHLFES